MMVHKHAAIRTPRTARRTPAPVAVTRAPDLAMAVARGLARGRDVRVVVQRDGSVKVVNRR